MLPRTGSIRRSAQKIFKRCGITKPPVDLRAVVISSGLHYREVDYFPDDVESIIYPALHGNPAVAVVNKNLPKAHCRFSLAHQLYHLLFEDYPFVLEGAVRLPPESSVLDRVLGKSEEELNADAFAVELLVPSFLLRNYISSGGKGSGVPRKFLVSDLVSSAAIAALNTARK